MKKTVFTLCFFLFTGLIIAQTSENYKIKGEYVYGSVLKHTKHLENLVKGPVTGGEIAIEWQTMGEKDWHQYFNFPTVGLGGTFLNLGNPDTLGYALAVYPYINIPIIRSDYFLLNFKPGAGISYVTKTFGNFRTAVINNELPYLRSNAAIGSHLNVYFSAGFNVEIPVTNGFSLTADYSWNHISNGNVIVPNSGINMLNAFVGLKYFPNYKDYSASSKEHISDIPGGFAVEITASGGVRQRYYRDEKSFPIASLAVGVYKPLTNFYRMGLGADLFYDGIYVSGLSESYKRTYVQSDEFKNKIRMGVSWQNELIIGRLVAGIHAGIYLYNPVRNMEPYADAASGTLHKGLVYPYDIEKEDGWFYTRFSGKYMFTNHLYAALGLKTHLQKAEFIEWGLGYRF